MRRLKLLFLFTLLSTATFAQKVALLVETASGSPIYSNLDIITMKNLLRSDFEIKVISNQEATYSNIRRAFIEVAKQLKSSDTFLFYYSGHGDRFDNKSIKEKDKKDDFLITKDMTCNYNRLNNVLIDDELNYLYAQIKAKKIIIIDACHSETMYKGVIANKAVKRFKDSSLLKSFETCSKDEPFLRDFPRNPKYSKAKTSNLIHLAAALENQQAEGSPEGGIFTLALQKALREKGNISFGELIEEIKNNIKPIATRLGTEGLFTPSLKEEGIDKETLYTKDIFAIPKKESENNTLETYLNSKLGDIDFKIQEDKTSFVNEEPITLKAYVNRKYNNIYIIEMLDKNSYKLLNSKNIDECYTLPKNKSQKLCQYQNFKAIAPFGKSTLYMIATQKRLNFDTSKDSIISEDFFDAPTSLKEQLKHQDFGIGRVIFNVTP